MHCRKWCLSQEPGETFKKGATKVKAKTIKRQRSTIYLMRQYRGVALIEVLIALLLLVATSATFIGTHLQSKRLSETILITHHAHQQLLDSQHTSLLSIPYDQQWEDVYVFGKLARPTIL